MKEELFQDLVDKLYISRDEKSIKTDFGCCLVIGGSLCYPGAPLIASRFCSLSPCSYRAISVPSRIYDVVMSRSNLETVYEKIENDSQSFNVDKSFLERCHKYNVILFGNGVADTSENRKFLSSLVESYSGTLIVDATGISFLSDILPNTRRKEGQILIATPHMKECATLIGIKHIQTRDPEEILPESVKYAKKYNIRILLKSYKSILIGEEGRIQRSEYPSCSALGKAGTGDALAGYLAGILSAGEGRGDTDNLIMFADEMIHQAGIRSSEENTPGASSLESVISKLKEIIRSYRS